MTPRLNRIAGKNIIAMTLFLMVSVFVIDTLLPLGVAGGVPYILVILVSLWYEQKTFTLAVAIACTLLTITGFYLSPAGGELWKVFANRALALFAIWTVTVLSLQRKRIFEEKEDAIVQREKAVSELKILKGFIPICASCKKIRDEEGGWNQMETYISNNSEADFSHSICPDCVKTLYPDYKNK